MLKINPKKTKIMVFQKCTKKCDYVFQIGNEMIVIIHRGYYMVARRYEISLRVLKKYFTRSLSSLVKYFSTLEEKFRISKRPCNVLFII